MSNTQEKSKCKKCITDWDSKQCECECHKEIADTESFEESFDEFFPEMCSVYKLHNVPRGVYMDIKSFIKSEREKVRQEVIEKLKLVLMDSSYENMIFSGSIHREKMTEIIIKNLSNK